MSLSLGLGLSLRGAGSGGGGAAALDSFAWTGWWNGDNYNAGTGVASGVASAGSSGTRNMSSAAGGFASPTKGSAINGHDAMIFNGTTQALMDTGFLLSALIGASASTFFAVVYANNFGSANNMDGLAGPAAFAVGGGYYTPVGLDSNTGGGGNGKFVAEVFDNTFTLRNARTPSTSAAPHIVEVTHNGTSLSLRVDGATAVTAAAGPIGSLFANPRLGVNQNLTAWFNGRVYEAMITDSVFSPGNLTSVRQALATKYGIALP